jgi:hypothetical protein
MGYKVLVYMYACDVNLLCDNTDTIKKTQKLYLTLVKGLV